MFKFLDLVTPPPSELLRFRSPGAEKWQSQCGNPLCGAAWALLKQYVCGNTGGKCELRKASYKTTCTP